MRKKIFYLLGVMGMSLGATSLAGCGKTKGDTYDEEGKLEVSVRNLYFADWRGGDSYLEEIEKKFNLKFTLSSYDWDNWQTQVNGSINGDEVEDVFHADIDSYNFANLYKYWAEEEMIKPLPEDMSKWPNIKKMLDNTSNIESLKLDGRLYGIPIAKNTTDYSTSFSPFTYVYRRDWAKKWGVYKDNDEYTWSEFRELLEKFRDELAPTNRYALADVEWGFPSVTNFYKQVPHCFAQDSTGKYVNNYTTKEYLNGLDESRDFMASGLYHPDQNAVASGSMNVKYYSNAVGVLYENLSYTNFVNLKKQLIATNVETPNFNIDDALAIMKIKGPDGKYALEGTDNWFSMTFFGNNDNDLENTKKMEAILDMMDWLLSPEGTRFAIFGMEGYDYVMVDGVPTIQEEYWPKDENGQLGRKDNGGKFLRYLASLGYDTIEYDPLRDDDAIKYLNDWESSMKDALDKGKLRVLEETSEVKWLTTPKKSNNSGAMRTDANDNAKLYVYNQDLHTREDFIGRFGGIWIEVLDEINTALKKN